MNYEQARLLFKTGDVVFFSKGKKNIIRRFITWFSGGPIYHVGIALWMSTDGARRLMLAESQPGGFRIINLGFYKDRDMTVFSGLVPWHAICDKVIYSTGVPYDFLDMALVGLHEKFNVTIPKGFTGSGEVCSVIVSKILQWGGLHGIDTMVSPQRLYDQLLKKQLPTFDVLK